MSRRRYDDMEAFKEQRARDEAHDGDLVDAAMRDILRGDFHTYPVRECERRALLTREQQAILDERKAA